jgi:hypothetical protein
MLMPNMKIKKGNKQVLPMFWIIGQKQVYVCLWLKNNNKVMICTKRLKLGPLYSKSMVYLIVTTPYKSNCFHSPQLKSSKVTLNLSFSTPKLMT